MIKVKLYSMHNHSGYISVLSSANTGQLSSASLSSVHLPFLLYSSQNILHSSLLLLHQGKVDLKI